MVADPTAQLRMLSMRARELADKGVAREMNAALRSTTVFLEAAVREAAGQQLPQSGGLARQQASQEIRTTVLMSSRDAGVRMRTLTRGSMQTDKGYVRHPVFGEWLPDQEAQKIPQATGWWTKTLTEKSPLATPLIFEVMETTLAKLAV
jgi:hypothetical protein